MPKPSDAVGWEVLCCIHSSLLRQAPPCVPEGSHTAPDKTSSVPIIPPKKVTMGTRMAVGALLGRPSGNCASTQFAHAQAFWDQASGYPSPPTVAAFLTLRGIFPTLETPSTLETPRWKAPAVETSGRITQNTRLIARSTPLLAGVMHAAHRYQGLDRDVCGADGDRSRACRGRRGCHAGGRGYHRGLQARH